MWAHKQQIHIFPTFFQIPIGHEYARTSFQPSEPDRLGGGRERVNPPPRRLVWRFWEVWRVWNLVTASTRHEARGLGGLPTHRTPALLDPEREKGFQDPASIYCSA